MKSAYKHKIKSVLPSLSSLEWSFIVHLRSIWADFSCVLGPFPLWTFVTFLKTRRVGDKEKPSILNHNSVLINTPAIEDSHRNYSPIQLLSTAFHCNRATAFHSRVNTSLKWALPKSMMCIFWSHLRLRQIVEWTNFSQKFLLSLNYHILAAHTLFLSLHILISS